MREFVVLPNQEAEQPAPHTPFALAPSADGTLTLDQVLTAWLHAKSTRTESAKTERAYGDAIAKFRAVLQDAGMDLDSPNMALISTLAQGWASKNTKTGGLVSSATFNQRLAILSSFYTYAIKKGVCSSNPILLIDRRPTSHPNAAHSIESETVNKALADIDRESIEGLRNHALLTLALATGRRARELAGLRWGHIRISAGTMLITWVRCKGGKVMRDTVKPKTQKILLTYLHAIYGADLAQLPASAPIWISFSNNNRGGPISTQTIATICDAHLGTTKIHATRHTFAVGMEKSGAPLSAIGDRLGHSNYKVTADYMKRLHSDDNPYGDALEDLFGI
jgi:integrase/recombinase XerD